MTSPVAGFTITAAVGIFRVRTDSAIANRIYFSWSACESGGTAAADVRGKALQINAELVAAPIEEMTLRLEIIFSSNLRIRRQASRPLKPSAASS
jgi:hypothetical protein